MAKLLRMAHPPWLKTALGLLPPLALLGASLRELKQSLTLGDFPPLPDDRLPGLSVVVAARNEAQGLEAALSSMLDQNYPDLEVILVDDRSSDGTSAIADGVKATHPRAQRLTVIHNMELPDGWLGKVHALYLGVQASRKPLVLLTDGDVSFSADALRRAVTAQQVLRVDHIAVAPRFEVSGFWEPVMVAYFFVLFTARFQPTRVHSKEKKFIGVGAFNLLDREMLQRMDWLEPLRLQVVDDLQLGRMLKSRGGRQFALLAREELSVRWFRGLDGIVKGLEKNAYAGLGYSPLLTLAASVLAATPFWIVLLLAWKTTLCWAAAWYGLQVLLGGVASKATGVPLWAGAAFPLAGLVLAYTMLRSALLAERRGAIVWRDTSYPLADLRRAHHEFVAREKL